MSDLVLSNTVTFELIDQMSTENKGMFGESLAGIWLKDQIKQNPEIIADKEISDETLRIWFSNIGGSAAVDRIKYFVEKDEESQHISWEPDFRFSVTLPDYDIRKKVLIESKVGGNRLDREQERVMRFAARDVDTCVYLCSIQLKEMRAEVKYRRIESID